MNVSFDFATGIFWLVVCALALPFILFADRRYGTARSHVARAVFSALLIFGLLLFTLLFFMMMLNLFVPIARAIPDFLW